MKRNVAVTRSPKLLAKSNSADLVMRFVDAIASRTEYVYESRIWQERGCFFAKQSKIKRSHEPQTSNGTESVPGSWGE